MVALNAGFFNTLPDLDEVRKEDADVAWLVYDLVYDQKIDTYSLTRTNEVYTKFHESLEKITRSVPGEMSDFMEMLQEKVNDRLDNPPDTETIDATF